MTRAPDSEIAGVQHGRERAISDELDRAVRPDHEQMFHMYLPSPTGLLPVVPALRLVVFGCASAVLGLPKHGFKVPREL